VWGPRPGVTHRREPVAGPLGVGLSSQARTLDQNALMTAFESLWMCHGVLECSGHVPAIACMYGLLSQQVEQRNCCTVH